jgi:hypothetical protein
LHTTRPALFCGTPQGLYQLFWMLACLYGLPVLLSGYSISTKEGYYNDNCFQKVRYRCGFQQV